MQSGEYGWLDYVNHFSADWQEEYARYCEEKGLQSATNPPPSSSASRTNSWRQQWKAETHNENLFNQTMAIRTNTNPRQMDLQPEMQDILRRNGIQAHVVSYEHGLSAHGAGTRLAPADLRSYRTSDVGPDGLGNNTRPTRKPTTC